MFPHVFFAEIKPICLFDLKFVAEVNFVLWMLLRTWPLQLQPSNLQLVKFVVS